MVRGGGANNSVDGCGWPDERLERHLAEAVGLAPDSGAGGGTSHRGGGEGRAIGGRGLGCACMADGRMGTAGAAWACVTAALCADGQASLCVCGTIRLVCMLHSSSGGL